MMFLDRLRIRMRINSFGIGLLVSEYIIPFFSAPKKLLEVLI